MMDAAMKNERPAVRTAARIIRLRVLDDEPTDATRGPAVAAAGMSPSLAGMDTGFTQTSLYSWRDSGVNPECEAPPISIFAGLRARTGRYLSCATMPQRYNAMTGRENKHMLYG